MSFFLRDFLKSFICLKLVIEILSALLYLIDDNISTTTVLKESIKEGYGL